MRHSRRYDFQGHPRSGSRSGDDISPLSGLFFSNSVSIDSCLIALYSRFYSNPFLCRVGCKTRVGDAMFSCGVQMPDRTLRWSLQWCLTVPLSLNNDSLIGQSAVVIQSTKIVFMASIAVTVVEVLWRYWLAGRKGTWPVKNWVMGADMVICLGRGADVHIAQLMLLPLTISCSSKSRLVLHFWYQLTRVVSDKGPLNGCLFLWR